MAVNEVTNPAAPPAARLPRAVSITRRTALGALPALGWGPALARLPGADPLVLVDGWLMRTSEIRPVIALAAPRL